MKLFQLDEIVLGIYFLVKLLYLLNAVGQFLVMNYFLEVKYLQYAQQVVFGLMTGRDWVESAEFPRIVFCDLTIRYLGDNNLNYTVNKF